MSIRLSNQHICINAGVAKTFFDSDRVAQMSFQESFDQLLLAPISSSWFNKMHGAQQCNLKDKSAVGDKAIAIHALLIDHDLDGSDRTLQYELNENAGWIKINLHSEKLI